MAAPAAQLQIQPCRYKTGKTLGAGSYSVVKECVHIDTGRYYAAKVINKRLMAGREHMVRNEIAVLRKVSMGHQNILTLVDYFETMNNCKSSSTLQFLDFGQGSFNSIYFEPLTATNA